MQVDDDESFALTLVGDGINIEKKVDRQTAIEVVRMVLGDRTMSAPIHGAEADGGPHTRPSVSIREFLNSSQASTNAQKITAIGHYFCHFARKENFSKEDLKEGFRLAREAIPRNLPRDVAAAILAGWIHEPPGKAGRYYVTNTGVQSVDGKFQRGK